MAAVDQIEMRLAELQRSVDVGNERHTGQLQLLVQRSDQAVLALAELRRWAEGEFARRDREAAAEEQARAAADVAQNGRIGVLESHRAKTIGVAIGYSTAAAGASGLITWALSHR